MRRYNPLIRLPKVSPSIVKQAQKTLFQSKTRLNSEQRQRKKQREIERERVRSTDVGRNGIRVGLPRGNTEREGRCREGHLLVGQKKGNMAEWQRSARVCGHGHGSERPCRQSDFACFP